MGLLLGLPSKSCYHRPSNEHRHCGPEAPEELGLVVEQPDAPLHCSLIETVLPHGAIFKSTVNAVFHFLIVNSPSMLLYMLHMKYDSQRLNGSGANRPGVLGILF